MNDVDWTRARARCRFISSDTIDWTLPSAATYCREGGFPLHWERDLIQHLGYREVGW